MIVWVTRDEPSDGPLATALRRHNLDVVVEPVIQQRVVTDAAALIADLGAQDWLVLTSPFAIRAAACDAARIPKVAVVGASSQAVAASLGMRVELVGSGQGVSVWRTLKEQVNSGKVCYLRSSLAKAPDAWPGIELTAPVLYETVPCVFDASVADRVDVVAVASPSAVRAIGRIDLRYASIGSVTSAAIRDMGLQPWVEASEPTFDTMASAVAAHASTL